MDAHAFIACPHSWTIQRKRNYVQTWVARHAMVASLFLGAIQYIFITYAASKTHEVLLDLRNIRQSETQVEKVYTRKRNDSVLHWGRVNSEDENIKIYIDGLSDTMCTVVAHYREIFHRRAMTFEGLDHFAKPKGEAYHARERHLTERKVFFNASGRPFCSLSWTQSLQMMNTAITERNIIAPTNEELSIRSWQRC